MIISTRYSNLNPLEATARGISRLKKFLGWWTQGRPWRAAQRAAYPRYRTAGYSFRVAHRVAICSARRSSMGFFI